MVLALASCGGGGSSTSKETVASGQPGPPPEAEAKTAAAKPRAGSKSEEAADCEKQLGEFIGRMSDLRQSLLGGLSYSEYVIRMRAIRDAYEAIPVKKLGAGCLDGAAGDAEDAFNQYLRAANTWGECAGTAGCAASDIEGRLQRRWRTASKSLDQAQRSS